MPEVTKYDQGAPSWVDLATTDVEAADAFYGALFGWKADHQPAGEGMIYSMQMLKVGGRDVGCMMPKNEQMKGLASHWSVCFAVDDCDGSVEKAKSMKAQVIVPPADMGPYRFAVLQDPQGAVFSVVKMEQPAE